jgi:hypothetical protein
LIARFNARIVPITLRNMRELRRAVARRVVLERHHQAVLSADRWPDDVVVPGTIAQAALGDVTLGTPTPKKIDAVTAVRTSGFSHRYYQMNERMVGA